MSDALIARVRAFDPALATEVAELARELEDAKRLRGAFLQNLSHEVRTPITVMNGMLDLLAEEAAHQLAPEQLELITRARHSSRQVLELVEGVLDLSKAEVGLLEARRSKVYFPDLFADLVRGIEEQLRRKGVRLVVDVARGIEWLTLDARLLQGLVAHLLSNAVKFTAEGEVRFTATLVGASPDAAVSGGLRAPEASGDTLEIVVEDTGVGIDPEVAARLSEPFRQADGSRTRRHEGLGIGLSVAHRMAEGLGATIAIDGRPGVGTRVRVQVPLLRAEPEAAPAPPAVTRVSPPPPLAPIGALADLANLARLIAPGETEAVAFAIDFLDRQLRPEVSFYAPLSARGEATVRDLVGHGAHGLGPGMPVPLGADTLARLTSERRPVREERPGSGSWLAAAVAGDDGPPVGLLAARLRAEAAAHDDHGLLLQIAAGWLGRELGRIAARRERAEWAATIGRDAKRPLGATLGLTQSLLRGLHGTLPAVQRTVVLEIERAIHRVILATLDLLDYERIATRGLEMDSKPFSLAAILDHVLSRQAAAVELAGATIERDVDQAVPLALGDLVRSDRALAVVVRNCLERLDEPRSVAFRVTAAPPTVRLEIAATLRDPQPLLDALNAAGTPVEIGEMLGPHVARTWVEAQGGAVEARAEAGRTHIVLQFPASDADVGAAR